MGISNKQTFDFKQTAEIDYLSRDIYVNVTDDNCDFYAEFKIAEYDDHYAVRYSIVNESKKQTFKGERVEAFTTSFKTSLSEAFAELHEFAQHSSKLFHFAKVDERETQFVVQSFKTLSKFFAENDDFYDDIYIDDPWSLMTNDRSSREANIEVFEF